MLVQFMSGYGRLLQDNSGYSHVSIGLYMLDHVWPGKVSSIQVMSG